MPIPMNCNGCGKPMKYNEYLIAVKKFEVQLQNNPNALGGRTPEFKAMAEKVIWNDCCRAMYMSSHDIDALIQ